MFNDSIKIKWKGEEFECPVTMHLVKSMERNGFNVVATKTELDKGGIPPISLVAELVSWLLASGGCGASEEEIYTELATNLVDNKPLCDMARTAINMFFPNIETSERAGKATKGKTEKKK